MAKKRTKRKKLSRNIAGKPPGYLVYTGTNDDVPFHADLIELTNDNKLIETPNIEVKKSNTQAKFQWLNIVGLNNIEKIEEVGKVYDIQPLTLENVLNTTSRPKFEENNDYIFVVLKMMYYQDENLVAEHVGFILKENLVITFQEVPADVFNGVRERLKDEKSRIREREADYLFYALIDELIDKYFIVFENLSDNIEKIEEIIFEDGDDESVRNIQELKKDVFLIRKSIFPLRDVVNQLSRTEHHLITETVKPYLRDIQDHSVQIIETVESYREITMSLVDLHMTFISNKMNNIMKVLTIMSTIFIPLTFIAGIYGMNFEYMPELKYKYAYPILIVVMFFIFLIMLYYFKRKKWF